MKFIKVIIASAVMLFPLAGLQAQKIAHIDYDSLTSMMPQKDSAKKVLETLVKQLESQLTTMQGELKAKYDEYQANVDKYTPLIKQTKEKDLQDLQQRIQDFQASAQQEIQKKNEALTKPINDKARKAIKAVAIEKGYKLVLDSGLDNVLYSEPSDDIMPLVKAKLGLK